MATSRSKIIRDGLVGRIPADQIRTVASRQEHLDALAAKLTEERNELAAAAYADPEEFADILQVLIDLASIAGVSWDAIEDARKTKLSGRGGFVGGHIYTPPPE